MCKFQLISNINITASVYVSLGRPTYMSADFYILPRILLSSFSSFFFFRRLISEWTELNDNWSHARK